MTRDPVFAPVLLFGASSQVGRFLLPMLAERGARTFAVSRLPRENCGGIEWLRGHLPDACPSGVDDAQSLISFAPLDSLASWLQCAQLPALRRMVATSSMSADSKRASPVAAERALAQRLRDAEAAVAEVCAQRGIGWTILRPTLIYGAGTDGSLSPIARRALRWRVFPEPAGTGLRQPVHAQDLALAALTALETPLALDRIVQVGGGERLSAAAMFARVRASLPARTLPLPMPAFVTAVTARLLPPLRGPLSRLREDLIADNGDLERLLGVHPRGFHPDARSFGL
ncbi:MAG: NAD-dependent epimerase/dehydratase family protein [Rhodanobacteraceae bacterium]